MTTVNHDSTTSNQVLSQDSIFAEMISVGSKLELPITPIQRLLLLLKFNWDIETLRNSIQKYADTNSFLLENGVCPDNIVSIINRAECSICCATRKLIGLRCQHMACFNCWSKYLTIKIQSDQCILSCMDFGCGMLISNEILGKFNISSNLKIAHWKLMKDSYINSDSSLSWCNRKCGMAVRCSNNNTATCSCGSTLCFSCKSDAHFPATCRQFRLWEKQRSNSDRMTSSWILMNTRECPRCFIRIQKNGGCNHMTCTGCRYEYCWVCSKYWKTHGGLCKKWDVDMAKSRQNSRDNSDIFAQQLVRFEHHKKCLEQDQRIISAFSYIPAFQFRKTLDESRRILMNSYVFGYYLKDGMYTNTLEKHQQNLEIAVENLDAYRTGPSRQKLTGKCLSLQKVLLAHCTKGAEHEDLGGRQLTSVTVREQQRKVPLQTTTNSVGSINPRRYDPVRFYFDIILVICMIGWIVYMVSCQFLLYFEQ